MRIPPKSLLSSSSLRMANCKWHGITRLFLSAPPNASVSTAVPNFSQVTNFFIDYLFYLTAFSTSSRSSVVRN